MLRLLLLSLVASMGCVDLPSPTSPEPDAEPDPGADPVRDDPVPPPVDSCFVAGTPIATPSGPRPIETLAAGDLVWAFDHETGERVPAPVRRRFVHEAAKVREVRFATGTAVRATDSHPFYAVREARYVKLEALHVGDRVLAHSAQPKATEIVALGPLVPVARVFNVEVATHHNYFAGGVLVHNKTRPIRETPPNHFTSPPLAPDGPRPPVSGGTLAVRGDLIVVAYPLRDEVHLVRYRPADEALQLEATLSFAPGDEPGRVVIATDEAGAAARAFVALRGAGAVAEIDLATGEALARHPVCAAPRGLHWSAGTLRVACAGGQLLSLVDGEVRRRLTLEPDLRDIVVLGDTLYVSLFRRAEILAVREGAIVDRLQVPEALGSRVNARAARVAWRMRALGGDLVLLGQAHSRDPVAVRSTGYGSGATPCEERLVGTFVARFPAGDLAPTAATLRTGALAVDFAWLPGAGELLVAEATSGAHGAPQLSRHALPGPAHHRGPCQPQLGREDVFGAASAVEAFPYVGTHAFVVLQPFSGMLRLFTPGRHASVVLGSPPYDTARDIFHSDPGGGLACASCHPEGGEDAHVWSLGDGPRRTQTLRGGIMETLPFHWDGRVRGLGAVMSDTFVNRMNGPVLTAEQVDALGQYLDELPAVVPEARDLEAVARGAQVFADQGCAGCHAGDDGTQADNVGVGGRLLQVPFLVGLATRAPYFHDGCAATLDAVLEPCGEGLRVEHEVGAQLTAAARADLVAYLSSR